MRGALKTCLKPSRASIRLQKRNRNSRMPDFSQKENRMSGLCARDAGGRFVYYLHEGKEGGKKCGRVVKKKVGVFVVGGVGVGWGLFFGGLWLGGVGFFSGGCFLDFGGGGGGLRRGEEGWHVHSKIVEKKKWFR